MISGEMVLPVTNAVRTANNFEGRLQDRKGGIARIETTTGPTIFDRLYEKYQGTAPIKRGTGLQMLVER